MPIITPVEKPSSPTFGSQGQSNSDSKARALAILAGDSPNNAQNAVPNQSNISVEALAAASPPKAIKTDPRTANETLESAERSGIDELSQDVDSSTEVTTPKEDEVPLSTQHAIIARKEKALRAKAHAQEQAFKAREAAIQAREAEVTSKQTQDLTNYISKDALKRNAFGVLADLGISYDAISEQALRAQSPEYRDIQEMKAQLNEELQKVREEQANSRKSYEQQQAESYQQALKQIEAEARQLVYTDPAFEMIKETKQVNEVVKLIERTFKEDGELLSVERAAELVEEAIAEEAMKVSRIGKIQQRLKSAQESKGQTRSAAQQSAKQPTQTPQASQLTTLTNQVTSTRPLSNKERAMLAFKNQLK